MRGRNPSAPRPREDEISRLRSMDYDLDYNRRAANADALAAHIARHYIPRLASSLSGQAQNPKPAGLVVIPFEERHTLLLQSLFKLEEWSYGKSSMCRILACRLLSAAHEIRSEEDLTEFAVSMLEIAEFAAALTRDGQDDDPAQIALPLETDAS